MSIDRAADALSHWHTPNFGLDRCSEDSKTTLRKQTRVVLDAIAEPMATMCEAGAKVILENPKNIADERRTIGVTAEEYIAYQVWRAMHAAMVKETK